MRRLAKRLKELGAFVKGFLQQTKMSIAATARTALVTFAPDFNATVKATGTASFSQANEGTPVEIVLSLTGLLPNAEHGWHIHAKPVAPGAIVNCTTTTGHFNPKNATHGAPENDETKRHYGDFENFVTDASGNVKLTFTDKFASLFGPNPVSGLGVVIHAKKDDLGLGGDAGSLTTGNAGSRLACGNIIVTTSGVDTGSSANLGHGTGNDCTESAAAPGATNAPVYSSAAGAVVSFASLLVPFLI